jgi:predicted DNA-binding transcriptional regulator AlpA
MKPAELLDQPEVAKMLKISEATLQAWRSEGYGPRFIRCTRRIVRYRPEDVAAFLRRREVEPRATR